MRSELERLIEWQQVVAWHIAQSPPVRSHARSTGRQVSKDARLIIAGQHSSQSAPFVVNLCRNAVRSHQIPAGPGCGCVFAGGTCMQVAACGLHAVYACVCVCGNSSQCILHARRSHAAWWWAIVLSTRVGLERLVRLKAVYKRISARACRRGSSATLHVLLQEVK